MLFICLVNEHVCNSDAYNYCSDIKLCKAHMGSVRCKCDERISVDVSPQRELFAGEVCKASCTKRCLNGGACLIQDREQVCFCRNRFVGEACQIDVALCGYVSVGVIVFLLFVSLLSCCLARSSKNREPEKRKVKTEKQN
jgi:hypothetical protein